MIKYQHKKEIAVRFTLDIEGNVQEYALSLLNIINNARVNPEIFYKVENSYSNEVEITCRKKDAEDVKEYLENFGKITYTEDINRFIIFAQYDKAGWEELFGDENEVDFAVEID